MSIWGRVIGGAAAFRETGSLRAFWEAVVGGQIGVAEGEDGTRKIAFTIGVIALSAKMAKADGVVTRIEVDAFQKVFHVEPEELRDVARVFNLAKRGAAGFESYARQIARLFKPGAPVLEKLLGSLIFIARADGDISEPELAFLAEVAGIFGFGARDFTRIRAAHLGGRDCDPYDILGVPCGAPETEVRAAYLKLVRENHPDRLMAEGMPQEFIDIANAQMAAINAAYDRVRAAPRDAIRERR